VTAEAEFWTAVTTGDRRAVETLLGYGADRALRDGDGQTAAGHARAQGHAAPAERLEGAACW
jgi:hypothetical protein